MHHADIFIVAGLSPLLEAAFRPACAERNARLTSVVATIRSIIAIWEADDRLQPPVREQATKR